jgi:hypothetical protein
LIAPNEIEETVPASDPRLHQILGIADFDDPSQAVRRMVRDAGLPHVRFSSRRIRFSLPALRRWAAERIADSVKNEEAQKSSESLANAA